MWEWLSINWSNSTSRLALLSAFLGAAVLLSSSSAGAETRQVVITTGGLHPGRLEATIADEVLFVNDTGRLVHVEFLGSQSRHHVAQVPGRISAVFHQEGPHRYVVHIESDTDRRELRGVVEVGHVPQRDLRPPTCGWLTVEGICVAP